MSRVLKTGTNQVTQKYAQHKGWAKGIDIVKSPNLTDAIVAHSAGTVIKVMTGQVNGRNDIEGFGYGNYVMVLHEDNYVTVYAHLRDVYVHKGQVVGKGQEIGYMGNTGNSFGAHLHFEVRKYKENPKGLTNVHDTDKFDWCDPTPYIDADLPYALLTDEMWRVQTGAFYSEENAVNLANELKSKGYKAIIKYYEGMYHVQVNAYKNKLYATAFSLKLKLAGYKTFITNKTGVDIPF